MKAPTLTPESLDAAFAGERDAMGIVYALYELSLPGFSRDANGTDGGIPACSPETWDMVEAAVARWAGKGRRGHVRTQQWPMASLNYGFREVPGMPLGEVDASGTTVTERVRP